MDEKKYSQLYQALLQEVLQFHSGNQRRIRKGMLSPVSYTHLDVYKRQQ